MNFTVGIELENDVLADPLTRGPELARILRELAERLERDCPARDVQWLRDINGNRVGTWGLK
jgi:hypothetical protein